VVTEGQGEGVLINKLRNLLMRIETSCVAASRFMLCGIRLECPLKQRLLCLRREESQE
jgi:hypothetical protein